MKVALLKQKTFKNINKSRRILTDAERLLAAFGIVLSLAVLFAPNLFSWGGQAQEIFQYISIAIFILVIVFAAVSYIMRRWIGQSPLQVILSNIDKSYFYDRLEHDWHSVFRRGEIPFWRGILQPVKTEKDLESFNRLNAEAFVATGSAWGYGYDLVSRRNATLFKAEPRIFHLICNNKGKFIGFSFIIPVGRSFRDLYLKGRISDSEINGEFIPKPGEDVESLILFAVGKNYLKEPAPELDHSDQNSFALLYLRALSLHIRSIMAAYKLKDVELIVQPEKTSIIKLLERYGFTEVGERSADGFPFYATMLSRVLERLDRKLLMRPA